MSALKSFLTVENKRKFIEIIVSDLLTFTPTSLLQRFQQKNEVDLYIKNLQHQCTKPLLVVNQVCVQPNLQKLVDEIILDIKVGEKCSINSENKTHNFIDTIAKLVSPDCSFFDIIIATIYHILINADSYKHNFLVIKEGFHEGIFNNCIYSVVANLLQCPIFILKLGNGMPEVDKNFPSHTTNKVPKYLLVYKDDYYPMYPNYMGPTIIGPVLWTNNEIDITSSGSKNGKQLQNPLTYAMNELIGGADPSKILDKCKEKIDLDLKTLANARIVRYSTVHQVNGFAYINLLPFFNVSLYPVSTADGKLGLSQSISLLLCGTLFNESLFYTANILKLQDSLLCNKLVQNPEDSLTNFQFMDCFVMSIVLERQVHVYYFQNSDSTKLNVSLFKYNDDMPLREPLMIFLNKNRYHALLKISDDVNVLHINGQRFEYTALEFELTTVSYEQSQDKHNTERHDMTNELPDWVPDRIAKVKSLFVKRGLQSAIKNIPSFVRSHSKRIVNNDDYVNHQGEMHHLSLETPQTDEEMLINTMDPIIEPLPSTSQMASMQLLASRKKQTDTNLELFSIKGLNSDSLENVGTDYRDNPSITAKNKTKSCRLNYTSVIEVERRKNTVTIASQNRVDMVKHGYLILHPSSHKEALQELRGNAFTDKINSLCGENLVLKYLETTIAPKTDRFIVPSYHKPELKRTQQETAKLMDELYKGCVDEDSLISTVETYAKYFGKALNGIEIFNYRHIIQPASYVSVFNHTISIDSEVTSIIQSNQYATDEQTTHCVRLYKGSFLAGNFSIRFLNGINVNYGPASLYWLIIPGSQFELLKDILYQTLEVIKRNCQFFNKDADINCPKNIKMHFLFRAELEKHGIKYYIVEQKIGQIVYTSSFAYYQIYSAGNSVLKWKILATKEYANVLNFTHRIKQCKCHAGIKSDILDWSRQAGVHMRSTTTSAAGSNYSGISRTSSFFESNVSFGTKNCQFGIPGGMPVLSPELPMFGNYESDDSILSDERPPFNQPRNFIEQLPLVSNRSTTNLYAIKTSTNTTISHEAKPNTVNECNVQSKPKPGELETISTFKRPGQRKSPRLRAKNLSSTYKTCSVIDSSILPESRRTSEKATSSIVNNKIEKTMDVPISKYSKNQKKIIKSSGKWGCYLYKQEEEAEHTDDCDILYRSKEIVRKHIEEVHDKTLGASCSVVPSTPLEHIVHGQEVHKGYVALCACKKGFLTIELRDNHANTECELAQELLVAVNTPTVQEEGTDLPQYSSASSDVIVNLNPENGNALSCDVQMDDEQL